MAEETPIATPFTRLRKDIVSTNENLKVALIPFDGTEAPEVEKWFETDQEIGRHYYTSKGIKDYQAFVNEIKKWDYFNFLENPRWRAVFWFHLCRSD